ncbi:MAG: NADAR domain-containing protein [Alphaproteobacteria bacterium]|nr:NADAR domain-containing protein [Alphaproteobacteria bacterium]
MSDIDSSHGIAGGTAGIVDHITPGAGPGSREHDGRDAGDIDMARDGVDLLFASIARRLCPEDALLAPDRDRLLWNAVEYLRSHVGRLEARLDNRLKPRQHEQGEDRDADAGDDDDAGDEEFLKAEQAEATQRQIDVLRAALDHALMRYGEVVGRPWLVRHSSLDMQGSELGLGAQIDAEAFLEARGAWQPAEDTLTRVREAMEEQAEKRAKLRASALGREVPEPLAELGLSGSDTGENTAAALAGMFQALSLVYPDGTQLQDERSAGAWRLVRLFDATAEQASADAMKRMPDHPALPGESEAEAVAAFDEGTRSFMRRIEMLARATDGAAALYLQTTEEDWERRDPTMTAAGGPRTPAHAGLTGEHYAATHRIAQLGHPSPLPLDGPHVVIAGGAELDPETSREAVEAALERLHERIPEMVLHYAARLQDRGGKARRQGVDPIVRRWATARGVPLIPHPPRWDAENGRYDIHGRDDGWIAMKPELVVDFGGGNAHRRFLSLAERNGIPYRSAGVRAPSQALETGTRSAAPDGSDPETAATDMAAQGRHMLAASRESQAEVQGAADESRHDPDAQIAPAAQPAPRNYGTREACVFRSTRGQWGIFSNFARLPGPISAADRDFTTSEHLYQASKFRQSPEVQARIAGARTPRDAAKLGRDKGNEPDADWNDRRIDAMRWAIRMKREAHPELVDAALEKTGDLPIVESSTKGDTFWGAQPEGDRLVGRNVLGRLWMELRQQIRDGDPGARASAWPDPLTPAPLSASASQSVESDVPEPRAERNRADTEPRTLRWAGIGARKTPEAVLADMSGLARQMAGAGFHLASGGAEGADAAFAAGTPVGQRTIWLPWEGYNKLRGPDCRTLSPERMRECLAIAEEHHPAWHRCSDGVKKMHARNVAILLGPDLDRPVDAVVCWTAGGREEGGTGEALRIAASRGIPVLNLGSMTMQAVQERLRQLQQAPASRQQQDRRPDPAPTRTRETARTAGEERRQRRDLRRERALTRIRGMLREFDITTLPRDALAELRAAGQADRPDDERLHALTPDQLVDGLDRLNQQIEQLRATMPASGGAVPEGRESAIRIAAMEEAADRFHAVLADKTLAGMREEDSRDIRDGGPSLNTQDRKFAADTQKQVLAVMLSVWRLAREGPLATESNRLVSKAAGAFAAQHRWVDDILAAETRERSGLGLDHAPGSAEETAALARGAADAGEAGEDYEYMRTAAEQQQKDDAYLALAVRARRLDLMTRTAETFSEAVRIDMSREFRERDRLRTQHLDGAETPDAVREREKELRAAHRQLIDSAFGNLETLCPVDHVSGEDRDRLLSRFAGVFRELARELEASVQRTVGKGKNADSFHRRQAAANYMRELVGYAEKELARKTDRQAHVWTPRETQNAGEWLMDRLRRARDRRRAESLAPEGRHLAIVGGRSLGEEHGQRIAQLLNHERARNPGTPLVLHCIEQEGAGLHAAKWAAMHGVACVTHRPKRYSASQLRKRDALLLGVPPDTLWNFGADPDRDKAAHMLVESARKAEHPIEIRNIESETDGLIVSETVIDPPLAVNREFKRIFAAWQEADNAGDDGALIYRPGIEELQPDIDRILATPHLTGDERSFLTNFKGALDSESRVRDEIDSAIQRGRKHLAQYEALMERRGPHAEGTVLFDTDPDYRKWELHARQIVRTFENWFAIDDEQRDHIDRRRLDLTDIAAELRAIRRTARSAELPPHRVEIPLENEPGPVDQRLDPKRHADLMERALLPEDERDAQAVAELARWSRAWPKESLNLFRLYVDDAVQAGQKVSMHRLAYGLPPALAAGMEHINREIWAREAVAIGQRQQMRERGMGLSA